MIIIVLRLFCCSMLVVLLACVWTPVNHGHETESVQLAPKSAKLEEDENRDYSNADSKEILKLVITDWMTNPEVKEQPYSYLIDPDRTDETSKPKLKRLLIDEKYVPKGFDLKITGVTVKRFDRSKQPLKNGEMCIRIDRFKPKQDGSIEIEFFHTGYGIIGGISTTYEAKKLNGNWTVEFSNSFDP